MTLDPMSKATMTSLPTNGNASPVIGQPNYDSSTNNTTTNNTTTNNDTQNTKTYAFAPAAICHNTNQNINNNHTVKQANGGGGGGIVTADRQLAIRSSLLPPNEVTFCDVSSTDEDDDDDDEEDANSDDDGANDEDTTSLATTGTGSRRRPNAKRFNSTSNDADADSIMSSVSKARPKPEIPDGGYGWVVVFSSLVVSLIADGISFSFGLLYTEFLLYFGESKSKTAWIGSIFLAVPLLSGPVMSNLVDKYGCQRMTIIGGVLSGIGFMLASISNSVEQLYWTFGVIGGLGLGIGYVTAVCSVVGWFDKRRTFATGIGASGTGIGTFLYAPLTQYLIDTLGWRGTCLILAGTLFNICVCGCLMRDPEWLIESNRLESRSQSMKTFSNSSVCLDEIKKLLEDGAPNETVLDTLVTNYNTEVNQQLTGKC